MIISPQIIRLICFVNEPTKSTSAGRWFGGPVRTRHCGLKKDIRDQRGSSRMKSSKYKF